MIKPADNSQTSRKPSLRAALMLSLGVAALAGCHHKTPPPPAASSAPPTPAPTATLSADPLAIDLGQSTTLTWKTTDATAVMIDGVGRVNPNGTQTVTPSSSTNFHLTAQGDGGSAEANVRVTVRVPQQPTAPAESNTGNESADQIFHSNVPDVFFDYDSYDIRPDGQQSITKAAAYLSQHPDIKIAIGGYCDDRGSAEYNLALGENRANSAKTALVNAGIAASRIRVVSYGKEKQFCTDETESCWQQNRRGQFSIDR